MVAKNYHLGSLVIVTNKNNQPLSKWQFTCLTSLSKDLVYAPLFLPDGSPSKLFKPLCKKQYCVIEQKSRNSCSVNEFDSFLSPMNSLDYTALNESTTLYTNISEYHGYIQVFAGPGVLPIDDSFTSVDWIAFVSITSSVKHIPTIHMFHYQHHSTIQDITMPISTKTSPTSSKKTAGKRGAFLSRNRSGQTGFLSYLGKPSRDVQSQPSLSGGPQEHVDKHEYWYYCNHTNPVYWPKTLHVLNEIARAASNIPYYQYKHMHCFYNSKKSTRQIYFGRVLISTINFSCTLQCNEKGFTYSKWNWRYSGQASPGI